jgi:hypothetical protein
MATLAIAPNSNGWLDIQDVSEHVPETDGESVGDSIHLRGAEIEPQPISIKELLAQLDGVFPMDQAVVECTFHLPYRDS